MFDDTKSSHNFCAHKKQSSVGTVTTTYTVHHRCHTKTDCLVALRLSNAGFPICFHTHIYAVSQGAFCHNIMGGEKQLSTVKENIIIMHKHTNTQSITIRYRLHQSQLHTHTQTHTQHTQQNIEVMKFL